MLLTRCIKYNKLYISSHTVAHSITQEQYYNNASELKVVYYDSETAANWIVHYTEEKNSSKQHIQFSNIWKMYVFLRYKGKLGSSPVGLN